MIEILIFFFASLLFGLGLGLANMTLPSKVIGFLDITGDWDPSLAFVMIGAILVHGIGFRMITKRSSPILAPGFQIPSNKKIDRRLIIGSLIFGVGWGLGGFCPGPALVSIVTGSTNVLEFLGGMVGGIYIYRWFNLKILSKVNP